MLKKITIIFIIALAVFGLTARAFCYNAEVIDISGSKYFPAVKEVLAKAEKSIYLVMFTIEIPLARENSKASQLIDALIAAKNRGVDAEVILDQNVDFVHRGHPSDWEVEIKLLKLYDPKELGLKLKAIEDKYGRRAYTKAERYAEIVFEENNPLIIEDIILKTRQYGVEKIKKAFDIVAEKNTDNPKKSYRYVVGIIEKIP